MWVLSLRSPFVSGVLICSKNFFAADSVILLHLGSVLVQGPPRHVLRMIELVRMRSCPDQENPYDFVLDFVSNIST